MPKFSKKSLERLSTCDKKLQEICHELIRETDFAVICGYRTKGEQDKAVAGGFSKTPWPSSKHNVWPSQAVDIAPYPIDWDDIDRFKELAARFKIIAAEKGINIVSGGDWKNFPDYPHFQLS